MIEDIKTDIIVVGSGPSGLASAIFAARNGKRVVILEQLRKVGAKILVSGGGKCNLSNNATMEDFIKGFSSGGKFLRPALNEFFSDELKDFFHKLGLQTGSYDGFHIFPESNSAVEVVEVLVTECERLGVKIINEITVEDIIIENDELCGVVTTQGELRAKNVIVTTGGRSYSKVGGTGGGYPLAKKAGHKVTKLLPAMVALQCEETWPGELSGLTITDASFFIDHKRYQNKIKRGSIMCTHKGLTGLRLLDLSGDVADLLQKAKSVPVSFNFRADMDYSGWIGKFNFWAKNNPKNRIHKLLTEFLPQRLVNQLCTEAGNLIGVKADKMTDEQKDILADLISNYIFHMTGTEGFERAMVTRGGIKLKDIDSNTMESKLLKGLYFAGEVLNIDGPCGGYNIQWAISSGRKAGISSAK